MGARRLGPKSAARAAHGRLLRYRRALPGGAARHGPVVDHQAAVLDDQHAAAGQRFRRPVVADPALQPCGALSGAARAAAPRRPRSGFGASLPSPECINCVIEARMAHAIRAARGVALSCRGWVQEAALRMLQNNLDPEVAEKPEELVVY